MFHGLLRNGVSYPVLYCLVRGKNQAIYKRLLDLIEDIACARWMTVFKRSVGLMVDFELSFINAVHPFQAGRNITCCFFHFVANIKKKARPIIETIKKAVGQNTPEVRLAEKIKRAVMMLPLLPIDLITVEVVQIIFGDGLPPFPGAPATLQSCTTT